jgi:hypothetical protein
VCGFTESWAEGGFREDHWQVALSEYLLSLLWQIPALLGQLA